ncbi:MAG: hypothetical protein KI793_28105 [Rivularia sp. (in: Bacteria)]|nr:hypothetical protein [Rivularia sp. MS3]
MSVQIFKIVEQLKALSLIETSQLVKQIENTFSILQGFTDVLVRS